jgi:hypothetical protein
MMAHPSESRFPLFRLITVLWLTIISAVVVGNRVMLSRLRDDAQTNAQRTEVTTLQDRLATLERQLSAIQHQPISVSQANFATARQALDDRLIRIEQAIGDTATTGDVAGLQNRLSTIEARMAKARQTAVLTAPSVFHNMAAADKPTVIEPPFTVLGIELRGGERFLSVAPGGAHSLAQVHVLRPGESQDDWQLETLDSRTATFRVGGRLQRIELP